MTIKRIVADIATKDVAAVQTFYTGLFGLEVLMDVGWITTLGTGTQAPVQISIASQGGSGAPVPALSIEVDDVDAVHARAVTQGHAITYPLTDEPWGVRRFFVTDPTGRILNVLAHAGE